MFFQKEIETMKRSELEALQLERLKWTVDYCYKNVPFYTKKLDEAGISADKIKSLSDINSPFVTSDDSGTVVTDVFSVEGEGIVKIIVVNKNLNAIVSPSIYSGRSGIPIKGNNIIAIAAVVAVVAIIITNGLLVILMLKSIMEPMTILQTATHELRDGNLDYKVPYSSKNEIGQVCADFEEMRQRLKESV